MYSSYALIIEYGEARRAHIHPEGNFGKEIATELNTGCRYAICHKFVTGKFGKTMYSSLVFNFIIYSAIVIAKRNC